MSITAEGLTVETEVGHSGYEGCSHSVCVELPMPELIKLLEAHGYNVEKPEPCTCTMGPVHASYCGVYKR